MQTAKKPKTTKPIVRVEQEEYYMQVESDGTPITGEVKRVDVVIKEIPRSGFAITYLSTIIQMIDAIGNKKLKVVKYILKNMDSNNKLNETTAEIAEHCEVSRPVVIETLKMLEEIGVVARKVGLIMLSPKLVHRGSAQRERFLMTKFYELQEKENQPSTEADAV